MPDIDWNDLRFVLAVARTRTIAAAARTLRVNETTVSRRLRRAELALQSSLFERVDGTLRPTETGQAVIDRAERIEAEVSALDERAARIDGMAAGIVRVTSIPLIVNRLLLPAVRSLYDAYPGLHLETVAEPRNLSISRRDADIALRLARPDREQAVLARKIAVLKYAAYGPTGRKSANLPWITYEEGLAAQPHVIWINHALKREGSRPILTVNDSEVALQGIKLGLGRSLLPCAIGDREPGLRRLGNGTPVLEREAWLLVHPGARRLERVNAVIEWIEETIGSN